jgi:L-ascorbate metabolism protein UlaG (beta-lactamase superfamily)
MRVCITRVINACVLLELGPHAILTDPYFTRHWYLPFSEPFGLEPQDLPPLSVILGAHSVPDHWDPAAMRGYRHSRDLPVLVATASMRRKAMRAGFLRVEQAAWGSRRQIASDLEIEVVAAQRSGGLRVNNYVVTAGGVRVFFGGEARDLQPLEEYRHHAPPVDIALLPVNGARLLGRPLVMDAARAERAADILGARALIPIHDAHRPVWPLLSTPSSAAELPDSPRIHCLVPGQRWSAPADGVMGMAARGGTVGGD